MTQELNNISVDTDIDIDFADRDHALEFLKHIPASRFEDGKILKHASGIYAQNIPIDSVTNLASIPYKIAKDYGYFKIDFLNNSVYSGVKNDNHLNRLLETEPFWPMLLEKDILEGYQIFQVHEHHEAINAMPPNSIEELAMFIALIRPAKRWMFFDTKTKQYKTIPWNDVRKEIWVKDPQGRYQFKKSHAIAYAHVIVVQMNLITEMI